MAMNVGVKKTSLANITYMTGNVIALNVKC